MPSKQIGEGEYKDIAHPINQEARQMFSDAIIEEYKKELAKAEEE
jgi:stage V sporulation protein G